MKDKKQQINVPCCPEFVSGGPEFVSGFPVAYGRKGRLLLTLLLRVLDLAFVVPVILSWDSKNRAVQLDQGGSQCSDREAGDVLGDAQQAQRVRTVDQAPRFLIQTQRPSSRCAPSESAQGDRPECGCFAPSRRRLRPARSACGRSGRG